MQSQPTEVKENDSTDSLSQSLSSAQHGLPNDLEPSSGPSPQRDAGEENVQQGGDIDSQSVSSGGSGRGRKPNIGRLKSYDRSSQGGSPVNRIEEYERSHLLSPRKGDGVSFQIIPSVKDGRHHISIEQFPNGNYVIGGISRQFSHRLQRLSLIFSRICHHQRCPQ